ncbi:RNA polymerase sigma factor [Pleionea sp. CnH1-48]|uniref:RNA polymerase sigma factor n=1 Tax=Pleionea sp. CnH1-48 TaxID=2954494 RepID=UPI0020969D5A|nr:sigma-70 family RNA polymerase sigma factor [Pleionea sp. CnH1-48]MCO7223401.1 sigma-70 family RNA polymerase sigma factor [Pleionea sp. CnH1-48]
MTIDYEQLIEANIRTIRNIARSYTALHDHEDLMQEIMIQLWRSRNNFRGDAKAETWLYRVAINTAISYQRSAIRERKNKAHKPLSSQEQLQLSGLSQEEILSTFVSQLNDVDRAVFVMYLDGLNASQMEEVLGTKANTIKVRISRLKTKFRETFVD